MFSSLYYDVFPYLGEFFGRLVTWATMSVNDLIYFLNGTDSINFRYVNLFTGEVQAFGPITESALAVLFKPVEWFLEIICKISGVPLSTPLWAAFLLSAVTLVIVFGLVKFIIMFIDLVVWG